MLKFKKFFKALTTVVAGLFIFAFSFNAVIIAFSGSKDIHNDPNILKVEELGGLNIVTYKDLIENGVGVLGFSAKPAAYVNLFSDDSNIFVDPEYTKWFTDDKHRITDQGRYLIRHENAHVLQKEMIAIKSGGYPSYFDLVTSLKFYKNFLELNELLKDSMPEIRESSAANFLTAGIESSADCFAQPRSSANSETVYYRGQYLKGGHCSAEQVALARKIATVSEWYSPELSEVEKSILEDVNIESGSLETQSPEAK